MEEEEREIKTTERRGKGGGMGEGINFASVLPSPWMATAAEGRLSPILVRFLRNSDEKIILTYGISSTLEETICCLSLIRVLKNVVTDWLHVMS